MKEDAHLIPPVAYDDPSGTCWPLIEKEIQEGLPLKDVTWKNPISSSTSVIPKLPLRFMVSTHSLFKDSEHPFRWFLAPYVYLYFVNAESLDALKTIRNNIKAWVDSHSGVKR
jgi:hypothetical protein